MFEFPIETLNPEMQVKSSLSETQEQGEIRTDNDSSRKIMQAFESASLFVD